MTSYFDDKVAHVREMSEEGLSSEAFLNCVENVEREVIQDVSLVTGDREFPEELREKIQGVIACKAIRATKGLPMNKPAVEWVEATQTSLLLSDLHSAFHAVGSARIQTRFGIVSDNPRDFLVRRKEHDEERYKDL